MAATGFLRHFQNCHHHDINKFAPFYIGATRYGWVTKELGLHLPRAMNFFRPYKGGITLAAQLDHFTNRSDALGFAATWLAAHYGDELRLEMYPIVHEWGDEPLAQLDRAAVPWFGVPSFGVHVNGFVRTSKGIHLWIGERAMDRLIDPGKLDNIVGGGQPIGLTIEQNMFKECEEEANIVPSMARNAKLVRQLSYRVERAHGLRDEQLFIFDLELPDAFVPRNIDGEVAAFHFMPAAEVAAIIRDTDRFKFNCTLVIIDFLHRFGLLDPADWPPIKAAMQKSFTNAAQ
jgi:8-oxo-dGTP pyrophosphatase MutT (NUDIX family)